MKSVLYFMKDPKLIYDTYETLLDILKSRGVRILRNTIAGPTITTSQVYIYFESDLRRLHGTRFDEVFGDLTLDEVVYRLKEPWRSGVYDGVGSSGSGEVDLAGDIVEYVCRMEEMTS